MAIKCPKCDSENTDTARFCSNCAAPLQPSGDIKVTETVEAPKEELTRGTTLADRYEIIEELGKGGMGRVYRVEDTKLKQEVALKLIKPEIAKDKKTIERFRNELKLARNIRHKNVCGMFDLGEAEGAHFITMEYVRGEDLRSFLRRSGLLTTGTTIRIAGQVCDGLIEAHRLGVVHRDLKSSNIMIDKDGNVRIMDFGIARSLEAKGITGAGVMIGTPEYMSPEQVEGKEVDQRSDIYSLGVILYEMVTGQVPFEGDTPFTIGVKHKSEMPKNPKELNSQIPGDLSRVILRCLEKDKDARYQSAGEVRSELENIEKGIPTTERVIPERRPLTSREITVTFGLKKLLIPAVSVVAIAIIAIAIWQLLPRREAAPPSQEKASIAVLPLVDLSAKKDQGYFCDGMTEAIIEKLSQLRGVKVSSRTSVMRYKNTEKSLSEIGRELGVATVLEGSVQREDDSIRVHAKLIDVEDNFHIWSDHYDRKLEGVFAIQSDIAEQIAAILKTTISPEEKERLEAKPTGNLTAYDYYLKAREYYERYRKQDNEHAIELLKKALELDPEFALAYSGLGDSYAQRVIRFGFPPEWFEASIEACNKAISLNPRLSEAHKALGLAYFSKGWLRKSLEASQRAVELNPSNTQAVGNMGWAHYFLGEFEMALPWWQKDLALDPTYPMTSTQMSALYGGLDDYAKAEAWATKSLELHPDFYGGIRALLLCSLAQGKFGEAREYSLKGLSLDPQDSEAIGYAGMVELFSGNLEKAQEYYQKSLEINPREEGRTELGYILWKKGRKEEAQRLFNESISYLQGELEQGNEYPWVPYGMACIRAVQGEKDEAFAWLQKAIDSGERDFRLTQMDPLLQNLRGEVRFQQMMSDMKERVYSMRARIEKSLNVE